MEVFGAVVVGLALVFTGSFIVAAIQTHLEHKRRGW